MSSEKVIETGKFVIPADAIHHGIASLANLNDAWSKIGPSMGYLKPDGWRFQIHVRKEGINLFSREGKDWSDKFPTLTKDVGSNLGSLTAILDTEVVGYDDKLRPLSSFGLLSATKYICVVLDALFVNNEVITEIPVEKRIEIVSKAITKYLNPSLKIASYEPVDSQEGLRSLYQTFVREREQGYDGIILKKKGASYFSKAYKLKAEITIDPVILGGYMAKDKRLTALLLAVFDSQTNTWVPVGKIADKGQDWENVCNACLGQITESSPLNIIPPPKPPSFWINPNIVVQVTARSVSKGARGSYVLRIDAPRSIILRHDKGIKTANTFDQLVEIAGMTERPALSRGLF